jgi:hypothetical protein
MSKITKSARGEDCTIRISAYEGKPCSPNDTTVFCHAPCRDSGTSYKSPDYGCYICHDIVDRYRDLEIAPKFVLAGWLRGIYETQKKLREKGLIGA